jgi:hypothetical protein
LRPATKRRQVIKPERATISRRWILNQKVPPPARVGSRQWSI